MPINRSRKFGIPGCVTSLLGVRFQRRKPVSEKYGAALLFRMVNRFHPDGHNLNMVLVGVFRLCVFI